jgi:hypothetical protein
MARPTTFEAMKVGDEHEGMRVVKCPDCGKHGGLRAYLLSSAPAAVVRHGPVDGVPHASGLRQVESHCALGLRAALPLFGNAFVRTQLALWAEQAAGEAGAEATRAFAEVAVEAVARNLTVPEALPDLVLKHADARVAAAEHALKRAIARSEVLSVLSEQTVRRAHAAVREADVALDRAKARRDELRALATETVSAVWQERFPRPAPGGPRVSP